MSKNKYRHKAIAKMVVNTYKTSPNGMLKTDEIIREELYSSMILRTEQTSKVQFPEDFIGSKFIPFLDIFVTDVRFNGKRTGVYKKLIRNIKLVQPNKRMDFVVNVVDEVLKKSSCLDLILTEELKSQIVKMIY